MAKQTVIEGMEKPKIPRVVRAHVYDAGSSGFEGEDMICTFFCKKCGYISDWLVVDTISEAKRGIPCPNCNGVL